MYKNLSPSEWAEKVKEDSDVVIVDVRTEAEFKEGHIEGALNISKIDDHIDSLDKSKSYYLHCRVGGRSAFAAHTMSKNGFSRVYNCNGELTSTGINLVKS
ncbi:rhodanese-like domain-containing protein [Marinigracilibium pacificum]|uniref:Rhodanese-like domain-containing protein n=1 Tax=Marinigracilibium pacificum TaxID=2729599 RepID=A0A848J2C0_9BACT|nr:rhodanese-like domain-containing protein [Marinigracilibium pacificum]NMM47332.1 rhodanese-like domain-containing protein [Marinigracilibium pacificum]